MKSSLGLPRINTQNSVLTRLLERIPKSDSRSVKPSAAQASSLIERPGTKVVPQKTLNANILELPPNLFGVFLKGTLARKDLPYLMMFVMGGTTETWPSRHPYYKHDMAWHAGRSAYLVSAQTQLRDGRELVYEGLIPTAGALDPKSSLAALTIRDPYGDSLEAVAIVDLKAPRQALYIHRGADPAQSHLRYAWGPSGSRLFIYDSKSKEIKVIDALNAVETTHSVIGDYVGAGFLASGDLVVLTARFPESYIPHRGGLKHRLRLTVIKNGAHDRATGEHLSEFDVPFGIRYSGEDSRFSNLVEMKNGRLITFMYRDQLIAVDKARPDTPAIFGVERLHLDQEPKVLDSRKMSEDVIRVLANPGGVFDFILSN